MAFELRWLASLPGLASDTARILAARTACCASLSGPAALRANEASKRAVIDAAAMLDADLGNARLDHLESAWTVSLPAELLLAAGGDDRLTMSGTAGLNRYGCTPWPRPHVISFASCTASSLSAAAFAAVERRRRAILADTLQTGAVAALAAATATAECAILDYFQVADLACAILTASGTDAALTITGLLVAELPQASLTSVLVSPSETGSGVPLAVQGRHFAGITPDGKQVGKGELMAGLAQAPSLATIALRDADGHPRPAAHIAQDCEAAILTATEQGCGRAVLHAIDGSKTGLAAPDRPALLRLQKRFGDRLDIVIDACQARIEPVLVRWYLSHGFPVLVTGSKFFAAPGFCGAVLFPDARMARIRARTHLPEGLACYMRLQGGFSSRRCLGLILRWEAALHEMAGFAALPPDEIGKRLDDLGTAAERALAADPRLELIPAPRPSGMGWSDRRSVFTFKVRAQAGWSDPAELRGHYLALQEDTGRTDHQPICQLGQPVEIGSPNLGGLRIAFSAAQIAAWQHSAATLPIVIDRLRSVLDAAAPARTSRTRSQTLVSS